jgi:beta-lactam-binding protein with PASTA domain
MYLGQARAALEAAGLRVGGIHQVFDDDAVPSIVLSQSVRGGQRVPPGTLVSLVLNEGP